MRKWDFVKMGFCVTGILGTRDFGEKGFWENINLEKQDLEKNGIWGSWNVHEYRVYGKWKILIWEIRILENRNL